MAWSPVENFEDQCIQEEQKPRIPERLARPSFQRSPSTFLNITSERVTACGCQGHHRNRLVVSIPKMGLASL